MGCSKLTTLIFAEGISLIAGSNANPTIGFMAFAGCAFSEVVLPNGSYTIGQYAFSDNPNLTTVTVRQGTGTNIPTLVTPSRQISGAFSGANSNFRINVPNNQLTAFRDNWSEYRSFIHAT
jgi:hypothetical protein